MWSQIPFYLTLTWMWFKESLLYHIVVEYLPVILQVKACETPTAQITHPYSEMVLLSHSHPYIFLYIYLFFLSFFCSFCGISFLSFAVYLSLMSCCILHRFSDQTYHYLLGSLYWAFRLPQHWVGFGAALAALLILTGIVLFISLYFNWILPHLCTVVRY